MGPRAGPGRIVTYGVPVLAFRITTNTMKGWRHNGYGLPTMVWGFGPFPCRSRMPSRGRQEVNTIGEHLQCPGITFSEHVRKSEIELGKSLAHRESIYLDTNFWILLRDANRGRDKHNATTLLTILKRAVKEDRVFCPISAASFVELMRQESLASRIKTAEIIDQLSLGVTIVGFEERISVEIERLIRSTTNFYSHHSVQHAVWRKISYVLGMRNVQSAAINPNVDLAVQKAFFDLMCTIPLEEMIRIIGENRTSKEDHISFASRMNKQIMEHAEELRSFKQAYEAEVRGVVDDVGDIILEVVRSIARERQQQYSEMDYDEQREARDRWKNLIYFVLVQDKARYFLPTLHIRASLYASLRWNKGRKFKPNDLWDFSHAEVGLGYCSAFFSDRSLHSMITERHIGLDKLYECHVGSSVTDAIELVSRILTMG